MRKNTLKLIAALLSATTLTASMPMATATAVDIADDSVIQSQQANAVNTSEAASYPICGCTDCGLEPVGENFSDDIPVIGSAADYYEITGDGEPQGTYSRDCDPMAGLPDSVDNSQSKYFPPINIQGGLPACTIWAQTYYQYTYTMNKELDKISKGENIASPMWVYNFVNRGIMDGSLLEWVYWTLEDQGCPPQSILPEDNSDIYIWPTEEKVWREALNYRISGYQRFLTPGFEGSENGVQVNRHISSADDSDLAAIKTALNNGDVLAYSTFTGGWNSKNIEASSLAPENSKYKGEEIIISCDNYKGCHRMVIVGYNDNIWVDINTNGKVDNGEMGALKLANSWGTYYGNQGFYWFAYDALNTKSEVSGVTNAAERNPICYDITRIDVEPYNSKSDLYLKCTANTTDRKNIDIQITAEKDGKKYTRSALAFVQPQLTDVKYSFNGSTTTSNDATMLFPLDNIFNSYKRGLDKSVSPSALPEDITSDNYMEYNWSVNFIDKNNDNHLFNIKNIEIVDEKHFTIIKPEDSASFTLDGSSKTLEFSKLHADIFYVGYENPVLYYKYKNASWDTAEKVVLTEDLSKQGYTHRAMIECNNTTDIEFYFSDDKGNIDDNNGNYYNFTAGSNCFKTENARAPLSVTLTNNFDSLADLHCYCEFSPEVKGGYAPYTYEFTYENLDYGTTDSWHCDKNNGTVKKPFGNIGNYRATMTVTDYLGNVATGTNDFTIKDLPFAISEFTMTPAYQIMTGDVVEFNAVSENESIAAGSSIHNIYNYELKNLDTNDVVYMTSKKADEANTSFRTSKINLKWLAKTPGNYSMSIYSIDAGNEFSDKTINFTVTEYNGTIIGDANNSGEITVTDALMIMKYDIGVIDKTKLWSILSDCNKDGAINLKDTICVLKYCVTGNRDKDCGFTGEVNSKVIPDDLPTEPPSEVPTPAPTQKPTEAPTQAPTQKPVEQNIVTFSNAHHWSGTIYCYYWSDTNTNMTTWPGVSMGSAGNNQYGQRMYTFVVPAGATYVIFSNGSSQTVDIPYPGGEMKYYPTNSTDSKGHYMVSTWQ